MAILLCAATEFEIQSTLDWLQASNLQEQVNVLITGVGLLSATYAITKQATISKPHVMLQAGLAGCFDEGIELGTTAVVLRETIGDLGVLQKNTFTSAFDMGLLKPYEHPWKEGKLENPHTELVKAPSLVLVDSVTVNEITTNEDRVSYFKNGLGATSESMEGAALHYVGLLENIPFLQLRAFSNYVGERNKENWKMQESVSNLNIVLQELIVKQLS
jgi:futalosine hydrolase